MGPEILAAAAVGVVIGAGLVAVADAAAQQRRQAGLGEDQRRSYLPYVLSVVGGLATISMVVGAIAATSLVIIGSVSPLALITIPAAMIATALFVRYNQFDASHVDNAMAPAM